MILFIISIFLTKMGYGEQDTFKSMNRINDLLKDMSNNKTKKFLNNMFNNCINNPINIFMYELIFAFIPIFHIFSMIVSIKNIFDKVNYRKED
jgi:hypothetical protein